MKKFLDSLYLTLALLSLWIVNVGVPSAFYLAIAVSLPCWFAARREELVTTLRYAAVLAVVAVPIAIYSYVNAQSDWMLPTRHIVPMIYLAVVGAVTINSVASREGARFVLLHLVGFVLLHGAWSYLFLSQTNMEEIVSNSVSGVGRSNSKNETVIFGYFRYENQIVGITYFTTLPMAMLCLCLYFRTKWLETMALLAAGLVAAYVTSKFLTRMPFVTVAVSGALVFGLLLATSSTQLEKGRAIVLSLVVALLAFVALTFFGDSNVLSGYADRFSDVKDDGRLALWRQSWQLIVNNPWGANRGELGEVSWAHNIFLDFLLDYGWAVGAWFVVGVLTMAGLGIRMLWQHGRWTSSVALFGLLMGISTFMTVMIDPPTFPRMLYLEFAWLFTIVAIVRSESLQFRRPKGRA